MTSSQEPLGFSLELSGSDNPILSPSSTLSCFLNVVPKKDQHWQEYTTLKPFILERQEMLESQGLGETI